MFDHLGRGLARLRTHRGLTQRSLSELSGVSYSMVQKIEGGQSRPSIENLERLLAALASSLAELDQAMREMELEGPSDEFPMPPLDTAELTEPGAPIRLFGRLLSREEVEARIDAAFDRLVRESVDEARPAVAATAKVDR